MSHRKIKRKPEKYMKQIADVMSKKGLGPGMHHIKVAHDDWCEKLKSGGECNCNPEVSYMFQEGTN